MFSSEIDMQHVKKDFYKVHYFLRKASFHIKH